MFSPLSAILLSSLQQPKTLELSRGVAVPGVSPRYWEAEDTTLDSNSTDLNLGWQTELDAGEGKHILIQFRGLNRVLGPNKHIVKASLVLRIVDGNKVSFAGASEVLKPWNQGPVKTLLEMNPSGPATQPDIWSVSWRHRRSGGAQWQHVGATGEEDSKAISGVQATQPDQDHVQIEGLADTVQGAYEHPDGNHGFLLKFSAPIGFASSQASKDRPKLYIQYEDGPPQRGADLSVTYIERKPEYQRYQDEAGYTVQPQDGVPVPVLDHPLNALSKKWPDENEPLVYVAHVKNVGDAPAQGFAATWIVNEKPDAPITVTQALAPGEETTLSIHLPYKSQPFDHRIAPLSLKIEPKSGDACTANNSLEIQQGALNVGVFVEKGFYEKASAVLNAIGSHSFEDWIQSQVALLNDVYFPFSRFSFATDGVLERVRIQRITVVPDGSLQGPNSLPDGKVDLNYDAELGFKADDSADLDDVAKCADLPLLERLLTRIGVADLNVDSFPAGDPREAAVGKEGEVSRGTEDQFPGLMGGDTRDDNALLPAFGIPYQPYANELAQAAGLEPTDLLSATAVAGLNSDIGKRRGYVGDYLYDAPNFVTLSIQDYNGNKVRGADLTFYQMAGGKFSENSRSFKLNSGDDGVAGLFKRDILAGASDQTATGHVLKPNAFGRIDVNGMNGVFLVKATVNGSSEWSYLKLWQLVDTFYRGQKALAILPLAFNLPSDPLDVSADVAKGKSITDSANTQSLASLVDGNTSKEISLPSARGSWVEIDLGRDLTVGQVSLITKSGDFWHSFEVRTYQTAQKPADAQLWTQESNWPWSFRNRPDPHGTGTVSVAYRGLSRRFRYLRIINTGPSTEAKLAGIEVVPVKQGTSGAP